MTKNQAEQKGLQFTGCYERNPDALKLRLEEIRKSGYKAYIVTVPDSKYSRSACIGNGYSIYTESRYQKDNCARDARARIASHAARLVSINERIAKMLAEEIAKETTSNDRDLSWLKDNNYNA